jgi:hypothetical protein
MGKSAERATKESAARSHASPFFKSGESRAAFFQPKLAINTPGDHLEQEADRTADRVMAAPAGHAVEKTSFFQPTPGIQRQEKDKTGEVLSEGASITYEQMKDKPGFEEWKEKQTAALKLKLWENQPTELKVGLIGFGLSSAGILGTTLALDPRFRREAIDTLQDTNVLLPLSLLPYSEYFPLSGFKYKLPTAANAPYTFQTEFNFDAWFKLAREKWNIPKVSLGVGVDSAYREQSGFSLLTGGNIKLKFGGGIVNLTGFYNQPLPPTPMLISDPTRGEPPVWLMRSLPGQLESNLPRGSGVFLTVDVLRLPELFKSDVPKRDKAVQRKEDASGEAHGHAAVATPAVNRELHSGSGEALPASTQTFMEQRFGSDFSGVRIHQSKHAADSAESIRARAYTSGNDIVFNSGEYQPHTPSGQRLLAHELAHTLQQTGGVQRKESSGPASIVEDLRDLLESEGYKAAYLRFIGAFPEGLRARKEWLARNPEIRLLFLKQLPPTMVAEVYSATELMLLSPTEAFALIDCWYPEEKEKTALYLANLPLFDHLIATLSPYSGVAIETRVKELIARIENEKKHTNDEDNPEFHVIQLWAPTVERKIKLYDRFQHLGLLDAVQKKFDPFTGLTIGTMERLTDTNEVDRKKAQEIYDILKGLPEEPRRAFLETALFAGMLEADSDAQKYYKKKYKQQYKALPHNWDFAFWFWNWGEAPFADRLTVDHVALMSKALYYEDTERRKFGFDRGIEGYRSKTISDPGGKRPADTARLIAELNKDRNFKDPQRLAILLSIAVRGGLEEHVTTRVLQPKDAEQKIAGAVLEVVESYGFVAKDRFKYHDDSAKDAKHDKSRTWYIVDRTLFKRKSGSVFGEQRGTFDLRSLQDTEQHPGSLGGMRFGSQAYQNDEYYTSTWLDEAVRAHAGSSTLLANLAETQGTDRRGQIFASIRNDIRQANVYAATLPIEGLNYFGGGSLYRSGPGVLQGVQVHLSWTKDTSEPDNSLDLQVDIENILINRLEMIAPASTLTLGQLGVGGLRVKLAQSNLAAAGGLFMGFLKNADFTLNALLLLLPRVLTLLPYAVMAMIEEFKGIKEHTYKDKIGEALKNDFSALDASVTFLRLQVRNMYDTTAGFLDDITIEEKDKVEKPVRQGLRIQEDKLWTMDALLHLKEALRRIDEAVRAEKSKLVGKGHAERMTALEAEKRELIKKASDKSVAHQDNYTEMEQLRAVSHTLRDLEKELNGLFTKAVRDNPRYNPMAFQALEAERAQLSRDLEYIDAGYFEDKRVVADASDPIKRYEARQRMQAFEAKYKSVDVTMAFRGVELHGGNYVRDLINSALKSVGFIEPKLEGIENINVAAVDASFIASGLGPAKQGDRSGVAVRGLHFPLLTAKAIDFRTGSTQIVAGRPQLENIYVSIALDFIKNPLVKDPSKPVRYVLKNLYVGKATLNGLSVKVGDADPLLNFPATLPVEVWGLRLWDFDPDVGAINLKIQDVRAEGRYLDTAPDKETGAKQRTDVEFGIDTTIDGKPRVKQPAALELRYDPAENSVATKVNVRSATIQSLDIQSPTLRVQSPKDARSVQLDGITGDVKLTFAREAKGDKPAAPAVLDLHAAHVNKLTAQGIVLQLFEPEETDPAKKKPAGQKTIQEVSLPASDPIEIEDIDVQGLRVILDKNEQRFETIGENASISVGKTDVGGIAYKEKAARGSVLQSFSLHRGMFDSLNLKALNRAGRTYTRKEFLRFFGSTRLAGADFEGTYTKGKKISASVGFKGKKNVPISVDYVKPDEEKKSKGYYKIRLPLARISVPALDVEKGEHHVIIPKAKSAATTSAATDVDVSLRADIDFDAAGNLVYDVYLDALDIADLKVFGLEYHNTTEGIVVKLDPAQPLHIPNVKGGGFRFSTWKAFDVFGKGGGWLDAAVENDPKAPDQILSAHFASIEAALKDGKFLAEKDAATGRTALDIDIASLGFRRDKAGNMAIILGKISGGFPKLSITQADKATGGTTVTTIATKSKTLAVDRVEITLGADGNKVIDATGMKAGELTVTSVEAVGADVNTTRVKLGPEALGADSALVRLNADGSREITITNIQGGKVDVDLLASTHGKDTSKNYIALPDPKAISLEALKINIDKDGVKRITAVKPTLRKVSLRSPSLTSPGSVSVKADLAVQGNVELGDGKFDTLEFAKPGDAFIGLVGDKAPIEITNVTVEIQDTGKAVPAKDEAAKPLTAEQEELIRLEIARDKAYNELSRTNRYYGKERDENPQWTRRNSEYQAAKKAYEKHRGRMVQSAKDEAMASMEKKYLDAVSGTVKGNLRVFESEIPLNIESHEGEMYLELSTRVTDELKSVLRSLIGTTWDMPFWSSREMRTIGEGLQRWWLSWLTTPTAQADIDGIAAGRAHAVVSLLLRDILMWPGVLVKDKTLFGINLNIEGYWGLDATPWDDIGIGLCEVKYEHPTKHNFYKLYGMLEYLNYVSPRLTSASGKADKEQLEQLAKGIYKSEEEIGDMDIADAVNELVLFIKSNLAREAVRLKNTFLRNIKGINITGDVSLRPQEVIKTLLEENKKGSFTLDKGKDKIEGVHARLDYVNNGVPQATATIGTGAKGEGNIAIPGATYLTQDKNAKVSYDSVELAPVSLSYQQDVYSIKSGSATISGLKLGVKKK